MTEFESGLSEVQIIRDSISTQILLDTIINSISYYQKGTTIKEGLEVVFFDNGNIKSVSDYSSNIKSNIELTFNRHGGINSQSKISPGLIKYNSNTDKFYNEKDIEITLSPEEKDNFYKLMGENKLTYSTPYFILSLPPVYVNKYDDQGNLTHD
ncbi:MAG: hypothetical protein H6598_10165 [Flavobacteriales bacterium]|nr:hypothetical protein [Flavobacteriales bacterium]